MAVSFQQKVVLFAALDGLGCAAAALLTLGTGAIWLAAQLVSGPALLPGWVGVWLSLAVPPALVSCAIRLRDPEGPARWVDWLGTSGALLLVVVLAAACVGSALAVTGPLTMFFGGLTLLPLATIAWVPAAREGKVRRAVIAVALMAALVVTTLTAWPARLVVWWWRAPLEELAARAERRERILTPLWIGPLRIETVRVYHEPFFITCHTLSGPAGLGQCDSEVAQERLFNLSYAVSVGSGWSLVFED